jgi:arabinose-5-phosphate isomerase
MAEEAKNYIDIARRTFEIEQQAIASTWEALDVRAFVRACDILLKCNGRVIVTGMGKSGHIARKIASTLSSTGTPALFLHPTEAAHGDMGMLKPEDVVIMLSKSGESEELASILPTLHDHNVPIIAITAEVHSRLAKAAHRSDGAVLVVSIAEEAGPLDLAPTASTTASLVLGDALAMALLEARDFSAHDFARLHPSGALGRRLTLHVRDLMIQGDLLPIVHENTQLAEAMMEMSRKRLGAACVLNNDEELVGIITDGDLRRYVQSHPELNTAAVSASDVMTKHPRSIRKDLLAIEALNIMESDPKVMHLVILDDTKHLEGVIHLHDIVRAGIS